MPTGQPTSVPTQTREPTIEPSTVKPTRAPTVKPTRKPTTAPSLKPVKSPTAKPTAETGIVLEFTSTLTISSFAASSISTEDKYSLRNATAASAGVLYSEVTWYSGGDVSLLHSAGLRQQLAVAALSKTLVATVLTRVSLTFYPQYSSATALYDALTANINNALSSGAFTANLRQAAIYYNTTALITATVASVSNSVAKIEGEAIDSLETTFNLIAVIAAVSAFVVTCIGCGAIVYWQLRRWRHADLVLEMEDELYSPDVSGGKSAKKKVKTKDSADLSEYSSPIHKPVKDWWEEVPAANDFSKESSSGGGKKHGGGDTTSKAKKAAKAPAAVEMPKQQVASLGSGGKIVIDRSKLSQAVGKAPQKVLQPPPVDPFKAFEGEDSLL